MQNTLYLQNNYQVVIRRLHRVGSTRDLRAELLEMAIQARECGVEMRLDVIAPRLSPDAIRAEWRRAQGVIDPTLLPLIRLHIEPASEEASREMMMLGPANFRFEVLRQLIDASIAGESCSQRELAERIGCSATPVRNALSIFRRADVIPSIRSISFRAEQLSLELIGRLGALPPLIKLRFERGARIRPPTELLKRTVAWLQQRGDPSGPHLALSGAAIAQREVPALDLLGMPRLDLVLRIDPAKPEVNLDWFRNIDQGLEAEENLLAPAPIVVAIVRGTHEAFRFLKGNPKVPSAAPSDVFLALLDSGLRSQAIQYTTTLRRQMASTPER